MTAFRTAAVGLLFAALPAAAAPPALHLAETPKPGDTARYAVELAVSGQMTVAGEAGRQAIKLDAKARHRFAEKVLAVADGLPSKSARHYDEAAASAVVGTEKTDRVLAADRRLVVVQRSSEGLFCYSPAGPLARDELDLLAEHFTPQCLAGLLPGRELPADGAWKVGPAAAQAACLFDGLVSTELAGKVTGVTDAEASFAVTGTAEGIEKGASVKVTVDATGTFDRKSGRVTRLVWKQTDERGQGPTSPASKVEATVTLTREALAAPPAELSAEALAAVPAGDNPPEAMTQLRHADPRGRYRLTYPRDWHLTGQTDTHAVFRLLDRGEFVAQATVTAWKKTDPGKHDTPEEFKKTVSELPGWSATRVLEDAVLGAEGKWVYRLTAQGTLDGQPVIQSFNLVAGPQGDQVVVTFALTAERAKAVGGRDVGLLTGIQFGGQK